MKTKNQAKYCLLILIGLQVLDSISERGGYAFVPPPSARKKRTAAVRRGEAGRLPIVRGSKGAGKRAAPDVLKGKRSQKSPARAASVGAVSTGVFQRASARINTRAAKAGGKQIMAANEAERVRTTCFPADGSIQAEAFFDDAIAYQVADLILNAQREILIAVYNLSVDIVLDALISKIQKNDGVSIRILMGAGHLKSKLRSNNANAEKAVRKLRNLIIAADDAAADDADDDADDDDVFRSNVKVFCYNDLLVKSNSLMHNKFIIVDAPASPPAFPVSSPLGALAIGPCVMTGSWNMTYFADTQHHENMTLIRSGSLASQYRRYLNYLIPLKMADGSERRIPRGAKSFFGEKGLAPRVGFQGKIYRLINLLTSREGREPEAIFREVNVAGQEGTRVYSLKGFQKATLELKRPASLPPVRSRDVRHKVSRSKTASPKTKGASRKRKR